MRRCPALSTACACPYVPCRLDHAHQCVALRDAAESPSSTPRQQRSPAEAQNARQPAERTQSTGSSPADRNASPQPPANRAPPRSQPPRSNSPSRNAEPSPAQQRGQPRNSGQRGDQSNRSNRQASRPAAQPEPSPAGSARPQPSPDAAPDAPGERSRAPTNRSRGSRRGSGSNSRPSQQQVDDYEEAAAGAGGCLEILLCFPDQRMLPVFGCAAAGFACDDALLSNVAALHCHPWTYMLSICNARQPTSCHWP